MKRSLNSLTDKENSSINISIKKIIFIITIILLSVRLIYIFEKRSSFFGDEVFTFGIANSLGLPILVDLKDENNHDSYDNTTFCGAWYDGEILKNYLVINPEERFRFPEVIKNKLWDNAPSNYELMVHFVCSFFPGKFSWAYPFCVNICFYIGSLVVIYFISRILFCKIAQSDILSLIPMIFWGLSICGTGAFTFFRMYGVLSFYSLLLMYVFLRALSKEKVSKTDYLLISFAFVMGIFTHTLYIIFAFWLTLFSCMFLFYKKRFKESILCGLSVLMSLISFMVIYPFNYSKVNSWMDSKSYNGYGFFTNLASANKYAFSQSIGFYLPVTYANLILWLGIVFFLLVVFMMLNFLFRKEDWYKNIKKIIGSKVIKSFHFVHSSLRNLSSLVLILILSSIGFLFTTSAISPITSQGVYGTRYLFLCMNPLAICFVCICISFFQNFKRTKKIIYGFTVYFLLFGLLYMQNHIYHNPFIFDYRDDYKELNELVSNSDVAAFASKRWILNSLIIPLQDTERFYFDKISYDNMHEFCIHQDDFYLIIEKSVFEQEDNSLLERKNYVEGISSTDEFANYILKENADSYSIDYINTYTINLVPLDVYYIHK